MRVIITVFSCFYIRYRSYHIGWEMIIYCFIYHVERFLRTADKAVSNTIIVRTKLDIPVFFKPKSQFIIVVSQFTGTIERRRNHLIYFFPGSAGQLCFLSPDFSVIQCHRNRRRSKNLPSVTADVISQLITYGNRRLKLSIRRVQSKLFLRLYRKRTCDNT